MVEPFALQEHLKNLYFVPQQILLILIGNEKYNAAMDGANQAYKDVPNAQKVCDEIKEYFVSFGVKDYDIFELMNPSAQKCEDTYRQIIRVIDEGRTSEPKKNTLLIHCFVGQGTTKDGQQLFLLNEYNPNTKYYKMLPAEQRIRQLGDKFDCLYQIAMFACSRKPWVDHTYTCGAGADSSPTLKRAETMEPLLDEIETISKKGVNNIGVDIVRENVLMITGPRDDMEVSGGIDMIKSLLKTFIRGMDHQTLSVQFPQVLEQMHGDARFAYVASNTIQKTRIFFDKNIAIKKVGLILVNTNAKGLVWKNADQNGKDAYHLFKNIWQFDEVIVVQDGTKDEIIAGYDKVQKMCDDFDADRVGKETMMVGVMWVGHTWYGLGHHRQYNFTPDGQPGTCKDGTSAPKTHGINKDGDAIANYEYCTRLCKGK